MTKRKTKKDEDAEKKEEPQKVEKPKKGKRVLEEELRGIQQRVEVGRETKENLQKTRIKNFFEGIFGKNKISGFLSGVTTWVASKIGFGEKEIPWDEFSKKIEKEEKEMKGKPFDIEEYLVSHRALGYGRHKENSKKAIEAALNNGEKQIEIDLRKGKGDEIYLAHDSIESVKNPQKKFTKLKDALEVFAESDHQDVAIFFDIKETGIVDKLDDLIFEIDKKNEGKEDYVPLAERHFVASFNPGILKKALEKNKKRPLMFSYFPACKLQTKKEAEKEGDMLKAFGYKELKKMCKTIDRFSGSNLVRDLENTKIKVNGKDIEGCPYKGDNVLHVNTDLPSDEIMNMIKESNGYICIPAPLATPDLIKKSRHKGVKVAVWGAEGVHIQRAIAVLGADLVISDRPDVMKG